MSVDQVVGGGQFRILCHFSLPPFSHPSPLSFPSPLPYASRFTVLARQILPFLEACEEVEV